MAAPSKQNFQSGVKEDNSFLYNVLREDPEGNLSYFIRPYAASNRSPPLSGSVLSSTRSASPAFGNPFQQSTGTYDVFTSNDSFDELLRGLVSDTTPVANGDVPPEATENAFQEFNGHGTALPPTNPASNAKRTQLTPLEAVSPGSSDSSFKSYTSLNKGYVLQNGQEPENNTSYVSHHEANAQTTGHSDGTVRAAVNPGCSSQMAESLMDTRNNISKAQRTMSTGHGSQSYQASNVVVHSVHNGQVTMSTAFGNQNTQTPSDNGCGIQNAQNSKSNGSYVHDAHAAINTGYGFVSNQASNVVVQNLPAAQATTSSAYAYQNNQAPSNNAYVVWDAPQAMNIGNDVHGAQAPMSIEYGGQAPMNSGYAVQNAPTHAGFAPQGSQLPMNIAYGGQNAPMNNGHSYQSQAPSQIPAAQGISYPVSTGSGNLQTPPWSTPKNLQVISVTRDDSARLHQSPAATNMAVEHTRKTASKLAKPSSSKNPSGAMCPICDVPSTGKHYGIDCCDGCKSFFRRGVRANSVFKCHQKGRCSMANGGAKRCRACRWQRCLQAGMNSKLVQGERDKLAPQTKLVDFKSLINQDASVAQQRQVASWTDVTNHFHALGSRIELWARHLPECREFPPSDLSVLIRGHRASHLLLEIFSRSVESQVPLMGSSHYISTGVGGPTDAFGGFFISQILEPLRALRLDEVELWGMKASLFFDTGLAGIRNRPLLEMTQSSYLMRLEAHVNKKPHGGERRERIAAVMRGFRTVSHELENALRRSNMIC